MKIVVFILALILLGVIGIIWKMQGRAIPCPSWLGWFVELENPFAKNNRSNTIVGQLDIRPGMTVMDIGCGPGRVTIPLAEKVGSAGNVIAVSIKSNI